MKRYVNKGSGYVTITMAEHRYVWEMAHGPIPEGHEIHHLNGDRADNRLENLECVQGNAHATEHARTRPPWKWSDESRERARQAALNRMTWRARATCTVEDCEEPMVGRGYCAQHHQAWKKHGDPLYVWQRDNMPKGRHHWHSKLTDDIVRAIRTANAAGVSQRRLARQYGVHQGTIYGVVHRKSWTHVE